MGCWLFLFCLSSFENGFSNHGDAVSRGGDVVGARRAAGGVDLLRSIADGGSAGRRSVRGDRQGSDRVERGGSEATADLGFYEVGADCWGGRCGKHRRGRGDKPPGSQCGTAVVADWRSAAVAGGPPCAGAVNSEGTAQTLAP